MIGSGTGGHGVRSLFRRRRLGFAPGDTCMSRQRNILVLVLVRVVVVAALLGASAALYSILYGSRPMPEMSGPDSSAPIVLVMPAQMLPVRRQSSGFGTAEAMDAADVPARVSATVVEVPAAVEPGCFRSISRLSGSLRIS